MIVRDFYLQILATAQKNLRRHQEILKGDLRKLSRAGKLGECWNACTSEGPQNLKFERFEFIGDKILKLQIGRSLLLQHPHGDPGTLTDQQARAEQRETFALLFDELELKSFFCNGSQPAKLLCEQHHGPNPQSEKKYLQYIKDWLHTKADVLEAMVGELDAQFLNVSPNDSLRNAAEEVITLTAYLAKEYGQYLLEREDREQIIKERRPPAPTWLSTELRNGAVVNG